MTVIVNLCIACGAIETPEPCIGTCADRRLDLVAADHHAEAVARGEAAERALIELHAIVTRLATAAPREVDAGALHARARAALRAIGPAPVAGDVVTTWECESCGRIEAPQPCIGVCIRPPTPMVAAQEHAAALAEAAAVRAQIERLAPLVRQLAWTTPRPGAAERTAQALHAAARALMA